MIPRTITNVTEEPISLVECREHLDVTPYTMDSDGGTHPHDAMILRLLTAAREYCESFTGLALAQRTYEIAMDSFPADGVITIPAPPLVSVVSISVGFESDAELPIDTYVVDAYAVPATVKPVASWPYAVSATNNVRVRFIAGYGDGSDNVPLPATARQGILMMLEHLYRNRGATSERMQSLIPLGVESMLRPLRVHLGMA